jgi:hypothetical protein
VVDGLPAELLGEGAIYGRYIARTSRRRASPVLYENSDFGKDMLNGLRAGLGGKAKIVATQSVRGHRLGRRLAARELKARGATR